MISLTGWIEKIRDDLDALNRKVSAIEAHQTETVETLKKLVTDTGSVNRCKE